MYPRLAASSGMTLDISSSCLYFPSAGVTATLCTHIQFCVVLETEPRATLRLVSTNCTTSPSSMQNLCDK